MRTPDLIATLYFAYIVFAALTVHGVAVRRRARVAGLAVLAIASVIFVTRVWPVSPRVHDWLPAIWLLVGYWLPGGLLHKPMPGLEAWLRASDRWIQEWPSMKWARVMPGWLIGLFELAYFLVHLFVPAGLAVLLLTAGRRGGGLDAADSFWTPTLLAGYICYGTLPWLQSRPPRVVEGEMPATRVRGWNQHLLAHASVQANTFPSGHVAVALVVALVVFDWDPLAGLVFVPIALLIATATVLRRYHYTADVALGFVVAVVCWAGSRGAFASLLATMFG
jgi:membrane-associated phospholipid phosphatase